MKRISDIFLAIILLILATPFFLIIPILIKIGDKNKIIFKQERPGLDGKPFVMYKFKTMLDSCDEKNILLPDEKRLTKLGVFLRNSSLDELPELFNVLKGDMSLVGPRPLLMEYLPLYSDFQKKRHLVKPGITGWAQVKGRNAITWQERFEYDVWYVENWSLWLDFKILLLTIAKVLKRENITQPGQATMTKFRGNE